MIAKQFENFLQEIRVIVSVSGLLGFSFEVVNLEDHQPNYKESRSLIVTISQHYYTRKCL